MLRSKTVAIRKLEKKCGQAEWGLIMKERPDQHQRTLSSQLLEWSKTCGSPISSFIELLGKHPIAAGTFSIVGFVGFGLGVVGYKTDRIESREATASISKVDKNVEDIRTLASQTPAERVPRFKGEIDSLNPQFVNFANKHDGQIVFIDAFIDATFSKIDLGYVQKYDENNVNEFYYYYGCGEDMPKELLEQEKESWDWRGYCHGVELHVQNPEGTDAIWGWRSGMYVLKGYWILNIPGTAMGSIVIKLDPVNTKDAY